MGFPQSIECPVIQNHAGDNIHRSRFLEPLFNIPGRHLIVGRVIRLAERGQVGHCSQQHDHQKNTEQYAEYLVKPLENPHFHIVFQVIDPLRKQLSVLLSAPDHLLRLPERLLLFHLHFSQKGVLCAVKPLPEPP